ncbi:MAG: family 78 glycoside hydrolase catalytic domain [Bacteroidales bacterium]|nr:family 78 glycoside hydrolase catalytic domain [Bacteroidales bacterium]
MKKIILTIVLSAICSYLFSLTPYDLSCEMQKEPLTINKNSPRFGWKLQSDSNGNKQTAYQIIIKNRGTIVWDSGIQKSDQSQLIEYKGKSLKERERYIWSVSVWDKEGNKSTSKTTFFEIAPNFKKTDSKWIGAITRSEANLPIGRRDFHGPSFKNKEYKDIYDNINPLALKSINLRKDFNITKELDKAIVYISGLGQYNLFINGERVGSDVFTPVWSDYDKTVYYNTYQIDSLINKGNNVVGITLGNGFYNAVGNRYRKLWVTFGPPTLFLKMHLYYTDGTEEIVETDNSWKYNLSPIVFNDIYGGEDYDARLEEKGWNKVNFNDSHWKPVIIQEAPKGVLRPQQIPPIKKMEEFKAQTITKIDSSIVLNMGQNLSGFPEISVIGKKGQTVTIKVGELLDKKTGLVSQKQSGGPHTYSYTLKGEGIETWHPEFTYYGFQYIQIDGVNLLSLENRDKPQLLDVKSHFIHNSVNPVGGFESSNEIFNKAHVLIKNAVRSNMQSMFTDCPHREKLGWLEETHLNGHGILFNWNLTQFFPKTMRDIADGQRDGGLVPNIVPEYLVFGGDFTDSPEWGGASVMIPWLYYKFYGDDTLLKEYYPVMKAYVNYLTSRAEKHIVSHGLGDWYDYGQHRAGFSKNSPIEVSATAHYFYYANLLAKAAAMQNKKSDARKYSQLASEIRKAFNTNFLDRKTMQYGSGSQFCNAIALFMEIVEPKDKEKVMENLKKDIAKHGNRLTTGDVGNRYLFQSLAQNGENELMYKMHNHYDAPGYGFQIQFGVTTLTEQWDPRQGASWNHFMMGQIDEWFFRSLAGIEPISAGYQNFRIQPTPVGDLNYIKAYHETLYGKIAVEWTIQNSVFNLNVEVPINTTAEIILPNGEKQKVSSGNYSFKCTI